MRLAILVSVGLLLTGCAISQSEQPAPFIQIPEPEHFIAQDLQASRAQKKKSLWILGGNWCHDSIAIADMLASPKVAQLIEQHYNLQLIDVGYVEHGYEFVEFVDMATYYATPTVLVIDPESKALLNEQDMHMWATAAQLQVDDAYDYFRRYAEMDNPSEPSLNPKQRAMNDELERFINQQEQRILTGFKLISELFKAYKSGNKNNNFSAYWKALAEFRAQLPKDIEKARQQITQAGNSDSEFIPLKLPAYLPLPWEA